ncbi:MAG: endolytic transglycosylase MltG [Firmicutes bacterium]|nr:endolytic transglycosylase MltG [Bacillota bacterium]
MARRHKRKKSKAPIVLAVIVVVLIIIVAVLYNGFNSYVNGEGEPFDPDNTAMVTVEIPSGSTTTDIIAILTDEGIIGNGTQFKVKSRLGEYDGKYKAGTYSLSPSMTMEEIMIALVEGGRSGETVNFTVPEGYDIRRTVEKLAADGLVDADAFKAELESGSFDYWFLEDAPEGADRLEGYLFPETYQVYATATEHDVIERMLSQFDTIFTQEYRDRAEEIGMSVRDVIILASVIEREAVVEGDRPIIAGVFYNRLEKGMALQSCATVQYILGEQKAKLTTADTQIESPYNTYLHEGLPPGPICSPGEASIRAALWPEETDCLYFLAKGDGSHVFSKTYDEHLKNKAKYID